MQEQECVVVGPSSIIGAGNGLKSTKFIAKNQIITEYDGERIDRDEAMRRMELGQDTHIRAINIHHTYIDGFKNPQDAKKGKASFANDGRGVLKNNATFYTKFDRQKAVDRVFLKATCDIPPNTEILVSYGRNYWKRVEERSPKRQRLGNSDN